MGDIQLACHTASWGSDNLIRAIGDIAQSGYQGVETTPEIVVAFEDRPLVLQEILTENKLVLVAISSPCAPITTLSLEEEIERSLNRARFLQIMGARYLVVYAPTIGDDDVVDEEDFNLAADCINEIAVRTEAIGIRTCLHPQFGTLCETVSQIDRLLALTQARTVSLCLDTGHFQAIGVAPASYYRDHHDRVPYVHFKDLRRMKKLRGRKAARRRPRGLPVYCELGKGSVNFGRLADMMIGHDYQGWVTVELDPPVRKPDRSAQVNLEFSNKQLDLVF